jgi:hypothetical protein
VISFCQRWLRLHLEQDDQQFAIFLLQHNTAQECEYVVNLNKITVPLSLRLLLTDPRLNDANRVEYEKMFLRVLDTKIKQENKKDLSLNVLKCEKGDKEKNDNEKNDKEDDKKNNNRSSEIEKDEGKKEKDKSKEQEQEREKEKEQKEEEKKKSTKKKGKKKSKRKKERKT